MGLFDFIKRREIETINRQQETIQQLLADKSALEARVKSLEKYQKIVDLDEEMQRKIRETDSLIANKLSELERQEAEAQNTITEYHQKIDDLKKQYVEGYKTYQSLQKEADIYKETIELAEYGVYEPHFEFDMSEQYKNEIFGIREQQKREIRNGSAVLGGDNIAWNGSLSQGAAMVKKEKKLMLRAFNGECDSFIADVDWNNILKMEERIQKSFEAINKIYERQGISISRAYHNLKLKELRLTYEYKRKRYEEKEEQRSIREQMREEEKARREIEAALIKAQKEEETYQKVLEKARKEVNAAQGAQQAKLQSKIAELEARIAEAERNKERAMSMAQQTRRGHVYIISNIGSFGENVYKIGMTRRLDPMDRVRELGDASVPFPFDVHAIIFCEDAPTLEAKLHRAFEQKRVNLINPRKEFFNVSLEEIENLVHENDATIEFTKLAEARDYRESLAIKSHNQTQSNHLSSVNYPSELFAS
ncbi:DUF4041 domain-containing protein [Barnesiella intestinihominis]|uniref:DUF4041 domain-containing protein n=1 Tax=Barnesiella intestinihominis TaxID=487174 RepID=UPI003AEFA04D